MPCSSLLCLTLALSVIFVAIGGTEHSLQTCNESRHLRMEFPKTNIMINDKYIIQSNVESNGNEHVLLKECCFDAYEFEIDQNSGNAKGRLYDHLSFWQGIQANGFVLDVIENGYSMPFIETPPTMLQPASVARGDSQRVFCLVDKYLIVILSWANCTTTQCIICQLLSSGFRHKVVKRWVAGSLQARDIHFHVESFTPFLTALQSPYKWNNKH